jgi:hypothetical protein
MIWVSRCEKTFQRLILRQISPSYTMQLGDICLPQLGERFLGNNVVSQRQGHSLSAAGNA